MTAESPTIRLERYSERHVEGLTALYNDPAVARQVLQMPYQSVEQRRKRLHDSVDDDRLLILVALHQGTSSAAPASNSTRASAAATAAASAWASPSPGRARVSVAVCSANCWTSPTTG